MRQVEPHKTNEHHKHHQHNMPGVGVKYVMWSPVAGEIGRNPRSYEGALLNCWCIGDFADVRPNLSEVEAHLTHLVHRAHGSLDIGHGPDMDNGRCDATDGTHHHLKRKHAFESC